MKTTNGHTAVATPEEVLQRWWGYTGFRPMQREIIDSILAGRDTLALMPTGGGKSLTYQVPAMIFEGLTIVITPLIALMKDQVDRLRSLGIPAVAVHSGMDTRKIDIALDNCTYGDVKLLYIAPERVATDAFRARLKQMSISLVAIDEAHCISQWGYDFRPSYLRIKEIRQYAPAATFLALTASATELVANDIMHHLGFEAPHILRSSFARPNLSYTVRQTEDKYEQLLRIIRGVEGSGIIYMRSREGVEQLAEQLQKDGINAGFYHAGLPSLERSMRQDDWQHDKVRIMVATNAFGMGIDKADVRFVVHYSICDSLEAYYQEAGRAGRDGRRSYAVLLASPSDTPRLEQRLKAEFPPIDDIKHIYQSIAAYLQVAIGDGKDASFVFNIYDFCHREHIYTGKVISALKLLEMNGYISLIDENDRPAQMMFCCSRDSLYRLNVGGNDMDLLLRTILRMYDGLFTHFRTINELDIASHANLTPERVHELLAVLWRMHTIRYIPSSRSPMIHFITERLPIEDLYISPDSYQQRFKIIYERFSNMVRYTTNDSLCRSQLIERYFGDNEARECGVCDICLKRKREGLADDSAIEQRIANALKDNGLSIKELAAVIGGDAERVVRCVDKLLRKGKISLTERGKLQIIE